MASRRLRVRSIVGKQSGNSFGALSVATARSITATLNDILNQFEDPNINGDLIYEALVPTKKLADTYCPVDTGRMKASGYLEKTSFRGNAVVEIGYGRGGDPDYTAYVHEMIDIPHAAPTRAKWLQAAVMEDMEGIRERINQEYRTFFNGSGGGGNG